MSGTASFGTRQGGLAQPYRPGAATGRQANTAGRRINAAPAQQIYPTPSATLSQDHMMHQMSSGGTKSLWAVKHPVAMRFVSALIDFVILMFATIFIAFFYGVMIGVSGGGAEDARASGALLLLVAAVWFGYGLVFESSSWQGTPGKKLTGLVITNLDGDRISFGQAVGRAFGKVLSSVVPLYIPYIMVGMTQKKQSMHDKMCGTLVYRQRDLVSSSAVFD